MIEIGKARRECQSLIGFERNEDSLCETSTPIQQKVVRTAIGGREKVLSAIVVRIDESDEEQVRVSQFALLDVEQLEAHAEVKDSLPGK